MLLAVALGVFIFTQLRGKIAVMAMLGALLTLGALLASSDIMRARFDMAISEAQRHDTDLNTSIGHRLYNYKTTPRLIAEKPLWGWGHRGLPHSHMPRTGPT